MTKVSVSEKIRFFFLVGNDGLLKAVLFSPFNLLNRYRLKIFNLCCTTDNYDYSCAL